MPTTTNAHQWVGPVLLAMSNFATGSIRRPASISFILDFEEETLPTSSLETAPSCDFETSPVLRDEYLAKLVSFRGPGFGSLNGGVVVKRCALSDGSFTPLSNSSVSGHRFIGFSALHRLHGRTGKPIGPEVLRFGARVTNIVAQFAGLDEHTVHIDLYDGPADSYNDAGKLLRTFEFTLTAELSRYELVDNNDVFIDCIRRMHIYSDAKMYILDDFRFAQSSANDEICGPAAGTESVLLSDFDLDRSSANSNKGTTSLIFVALFVAWMFVVILPG
mmetsp:Transcript_58668/g.96861  ORF Transcript_58668/g.96861 Transcript_58668/m.96861 type:complete len:276 (-) Transcript_58668:193-1020(-)